jgi:hypothetical protein
MHFLNTALDFPFILNRQFSSNVYNIKMKGLGQA